MNHIPRYRSVKFGIKGVQVSPAANGVTLVKTVQALNEYPMRLADRLHFWAGQAPDRTYMAKRDQAGHWRHISYAQALAAARHIAQGLLNRGLSSDRPVLILSENDLEHALLALGCQYVGVPYPPISPAYSIV